jgi:GxxExxY protein
VRESLTEINQRVATERQENDITRKIIGAAIEVHKKLGPGLLESAYEECLCCEMQLRGIEFKRQVPLSLNYKGVVLDCGYRLDLLVEDKVIVELKSIEGLEPIHEAQMLTYLKLRNAWLGLIINFNVIMLKDGVRRLVNGC